MIRNFTLLLTSLAISVSALAATPTRHRLHAPDHSDSKISAVKSSGAFKTNVKFNEEITRTGSFKVRKTSAEIIDQVPEGTLCNYARDCIGWFEYWGYIFEIPVVGYVQNIVEAEDNVVYLNGGVSEFPLVDSWVKGTRDNEGNITIPSYQNVYMEEEDGEFYTFSLIAMTYEIVYDEESDESYVETTALDALKLTNVDGSYKLLEEDVMWALCGYDDEAEEWYWTGYGDAALNIYPMNVKPAELPEDIKTEKWTLLSVSDGKTFGYFNQVGFDGKDVYISGLLENSEVFVKGTIQDDGKTVVIPAGQLLGIDTDYNWNFLYGGCMEMAYDDYYGEERPSPKATGDLTLEYDAEKKILSTGDPVVFSANAPEDINETVPVYYLDGCTIKYQVRNPETRPCNPNGLVLKDYWNAYLVYQFDFNLPLFDEEGALLDPSRLFYSIYIDGNLFTFNRDEYFDLPEESLDEINSQYNDNNSFWTSYEHVMMFFYFTGFESVGVQSVYHDIDENGNEITVKSDIVTLNESSGAPVVEDVAHSAYFDLHGRSVAGSEPGLYIRRDVMNDGSVRTVKVMVR